LGALVAAFAAAYALIGLFRHWHFDSSAYDLGIFDQAIWRLSRFDAPTSSLKGGLNIFGDHFHPVIALLAPVYWIAPRVEALIVAQSVLLAASIVPVFAFARRRLPADSPFAIAVVYALFWGIQRTAWFDFHELAFAPLLIGIALNAIDLRRWSVLWLTCAALWLVKEDMIPLVAGIGAWVFLFVDRRQGLMLAAVSLLLFPIVMLIVIPGVRTRLVELRCRIRAFAGRAMDGAGHRHDTAAEDDHRRSLADALHVSAARLAMVADGGGHWSRASPLGFADSLGVGSALFGAARADPRAGAADTLSKIRAGVENTGRLTWIVPAVLTLMVVASATLPGHQPVLRLFAAKHYRDIPDRVAATEALAQIPSDASVVAQAAIVPHLSHRDRIYVLEDGAPDADFVIAASALVSPWPAANSEGIAAWLEKRRQAGYREIFARDGWVVLTRQQAPSR
jgi:uncharacterized membrane protein